MLCPWMELCWFDSINLFFAGVRISNKMFTPLIVFIVRFVFLSYFVWFVFFLAYFPTLLALFVMRYSVFLLILLVLVFRTVSVCFHSSQTYMYICTIETQVTRLSICILFLATESSFVIRRAACIIIIDAHVFQSKADSSEGKSSVRIYINSHIQYVF